MQFAECFPPALRFGMPDQRDRHSSVQARVFLANGLTNAAIAEQLGVSVRTVTSHLDHIYARLSEHRLVGGADSLDRRAWPREISMTSREYGDSLIGDHQLPDLSCLVLDA